MPISAERQHWKKYDTGGEGFMARRRERLGFGASIRRPQTGHATPPELAGLADGSFLKIEIAEWFNHQDVSARECANPVHLSAFHALPHLERSLAVRG
jgi:hypothetical protein